MAAPPGTCKNTWFSSDFVPQSVTLLARALRFRKPGVRNPSVFPSFCFRGFIFRRKTRSFSQLGSSTPRKIRCFSIIDHQKHVLFDKLHFPYRYFTYARALFPFWNGQKHVCFDCLYFKRCRFTLARAIFLFRNHQKHVFFCQFRFDKVTFY